MSEKYRIDEKKCRLKFIRFLHSSKEDLSSIIILLYYNIWTVTILFHFPDGWMTEKKRKKHLCLWKKCRIHQNIKTDGESSD